MGEPLYEEVVGRDKLDRPCRVYAPVGSHETLLAYLVRRLLENGANTSFVNRIADASVPVEELVADPVAVASRIQPRRRAARQDPLAARSLRRRAAELARARPLRRAEARDAGRRGSMASARAVARSTRRGDGEEPASRVRNPSDRSDVVGQARAARPDEVAAAIAAAERAAPGWAATRRTSARASCAAPPTRSRPRMDDLIGLVVREAGKTLANAVGEVREAVDFLRYYAAEAVRRARPRRAAARRRRLHQSLELSAGDLYRPGRGGAGGGKRRHRQARRGDAADRGRGGPDPARRPASRPTPCARSRARARSARRSSPTPASRASSSPARRRSRG